MCRAASLVLQLADGEAASAKPARRLCLGGGGGGYDRHSRFERDATQLLLDPVGGGGAEAASAPSAVGLVLGYEEWVVVAGALGDAEEPVRAQDAGAGFAGFCGWLLEAMGYSNQVSPPGADRGVDIAASEDALGVRQPLLRVQCKSGGSAVGSPDVQALNGTLGPTDQFEGSRRNLTISTPPRHHS